MSVPDTYVCPVCSKPFDTADQLFDLAIASHEKDHEPKRNSPANLIRFEEEGLMWVCKLCGDPLHPGEYTARQMVIGHCRVKHDSLPSSSAPVTTRGGRGKKSGRFFDTAGDIAEAAGEALFRIAGKIFD